MHTYAGPTNLLTFDPVSFKIEKKENLGGRPTKQNGRIMAFHGGRNLDELCEVTAAEIAELERQLAEVEVRTCLVLSFSYGKTSFS